MINPFFEALSKLDNDVNAWGNKSLVLQQTSLIDGFSIPKTIVLSSVFFEQYVFLGNNKKELSVFMSNIDKELAKVISEVGMSKDSLIFRSSANIEGTIASCSGIFESIRLTNGMPYSDCIKMVWDSVFNKITLSYMSLREINVLKVKMAVLVQEYINGDFCGTLHTWDVINNKKAVIIEFEPARFEGVVDGDSNPIMVRIDDRGIISGDDYVDYINSNQITKLAKIGSDIEKHLKYHVEIEFIICDLIVYILQARKIADL